jgi:hypothetical protein
VINKKLHHLLTLKASAKRQTREQTRQRILAKPAELFDDPDGNMIEVYWPTGVKYRQPFIEPLDLTQSEEALRATLKLDDR